MQIMNIISGTHSYPVFMSPLEDAYRSTTDRHAVVLIDSEVHKIYPKLAACYPHVLRIKACETSKEWSSLARVLDFIASCGHGKQTWIRAIGGGTIQDIACFCASVYHRGVHWDFVPTTLLAQADSCIGAKAGINLGKVKNQIGCFHAPQAVILHPELLETLPPLMLISGLAEVAKIAMLADVKLFQQLAHLYCGQRVEAKVITRALRAKQHIIERDEREAHERKALNYGHTFGHALEACTSIPHGLAVAWGMDVENFVLMKLGRLTKSEFERPRDLFRRHFQWRFKLPRYARIAAALRKDKKIADGSVTLTAVGPIGSFRLESVCTESVIAAGAQYMEECNDLMDWA